MLLLKTGTNLANLRLSLNFVRASNYVVLKLVNLVRIAKISTIKTELKSPKLLPVFNSNSKVLILCHLLVCVTELIQSRAIGNNRMTGLQSKGVRL